MSWVGPGYGGLETIVRQRGEGEVAGRSVWLLSTPAERHISAPSCLVLIDKAALGNTFSGVIPK